MFISELISLSCSGLENSVDCDFVTQKLPEAEVPVQEEPFVIVEEDAEHEGN